MLKGTPLSIRSALVDVALVLHAVSSWGGVGGEVPQQGRGNISGGHYTSHVCPLLHTCLRHHPTPHPLLLQDHLERCKLMPVGVGLHGMAPYPPPVRSDFEMRLLVPEHSVTIVLGHGGQTVAQLAEASGAVIRLGGGEMSALVRERPINVTGGRDSVLTACVACYDILAAEARK